MKKLFFNNTFIIKQKIIFFILIVVFYSFSSKANETSDDKTKNNKPKFVVGVLKDKEENTTDSKLSPTIDSLKINKTPQIFNSQDLENINKSKKKTFTPQAKSTNKSSTTPSLSNDIQLPNSSTGKVLARIYQDQESKKFYPASKKINNDSKKIKTVGDVDIIGLQRLEVDSIASLINLQDFKKNSQQAIQDNLKKLSESDLFSDVKIYRQNSRIVIELKENPLISEIKFVGNDKIDDEALQSEISLKKRSIWTKAKMQNDLKRINELYIKSSRFLTKIEPKLIFKEQNRVEVIFDITEGPKAKIAQIYFIGNSQFSDKELRDEISTKQSQWWKFLSSSDSYDSDRIEFDKEILRRHYGRNGFADFAVISSTAQISPKKDKFFISFLIEEGIKYNFGEINIVNRIEKFDEKILLKKILPKKGKVYDIDQIEKTVEAFVEVMAQESFAFGDVEPIIRKNKIDKIVDVDFVIQETPRIYINQILIKGNNRTLDEVIRRELRFREGDPYNITRINRSKQRIENLGFFEKVDFAVKRVGESDKVDIEIEVKEKKTGELTLGVGYSTFDRLTGNAGIRESNLFGTGQELGVNIQKSYFRQNAEINYTKPYFLDSNLSMGVDLYKIDMVGRNVLAYDQNSIGSALRGNYSITEYLAHQIRYSLSDEKIGNVDNLSQINGADIRGNFLSSSIGHTLAYDKRNNRIDPKNGYYLSLTQSYSGVGGNVKFIKNESAGAFYYPLYKNDFILKFSARGGVIDGVGQGVRSNFGYFLGGNDFRGFNFNGLGPRAKDVNGNAKGGVAVAGKIYYVGTAELRFPLGLPRELGVYGALFSDNGTLKSVDKDVQGARYGIADSSSIRSSYGLSIVWSSPMGPIRLDFSKVARKESFDVTQTFRFSFGTNF